MHAMQLQKTMKKKNVAETRRRRKQKDGDEGEITRPKEEGIEQISSVCCSSLDDDDTASNGNKAATMTGKAGAAMDPQSLYARVSERGIYMYIIVSVCSN